MEGPTQAAAEYYVWEVPGKPLSVHLHLDVVDRLGPEIMRGFGAVPKRGAEVGGLLLGTIESVPDGGIVVRIEDFEPVACQYKRGPSYLLSDDDLLALAQSVERWRPQQDRAIYAVGYYRSHTREGFSPAHEDRVLIMDQHFKGPDNVMLLVKPFATKVSTAGFFVRENGVLPQNTPLEFPLRRRELGGEEAPEHRPLTERRSRSRDAMAAQRSLPGLVAKDEPSQPVEQEDQRERLGAAYALTMPRQSRFRWVWLPLSFVFLLLGILLGFQTGLMVSSKGTAAKADDYGLALSVSHTDDNLTVRWNRDAPAISAATKAVLEILDGGYTKSVDLDAAHLKGGSIIYRQSTNGVRFRLIVYLNARLSVTETLDWRQ